MTYYHYRESGLDDVYLVNGFSIRNDPQYGRLVSFDDIDGLHRAIGKTLIEGQRRLTGPQFRFLRHELGLSQASLGQLIGVTEQAVARWEKGKTPRIDPAADKLLRLLYREKIGNGGKIERLLSRIADLEDSIDRRMLLEETDDGWDRAA